MESWLWVPQMSKWLFVCSYWVVFIAAWKNSFRHRQWNRLVLWLGGAFAVGCLVVMLFFLWVVSDWPMNIGGKPNYTLYHNLPATAPLNIVQPVLGIIHIALWLGLPVSWVYAIVRIWKSRRSGLTPS